jgi:hypothetical protein
LIGISLGVIFEYIVAKMVIPNKTTMRNKKIIVFWGLFNAFEEGESGLDILKNFQQTGIILNDCIIDLNNKKTPH